MAEESAKPKKSLKKTESIREKAEKAVAESSKEPRQLRVRTRAAAAPLRALGRVLRVIGRYTVPPYFRNSWRELRAVTWPSMRDSFKLTFAVIAFAVVFGLLVAVVDYGLDKVFKQVLLK